MKNTLIAITTAALLASASTSALAGDSARYRPPPSPGYEASGYAIDGYDAIYYNTTSRDRNNYGRPTPPLRLIPLRSGTCALSRVTYGGSVYRRYGYWWLIASSPKLYTFGAGPRAGANGTASAYCYRK